MTKAQTRRGLPVRRIEPAPQVSVVELGLFSGRGIVA